MVPIEISPETIQEEIETTMEKIHKHYENVLGPGVKPFLERKEKELRERIRLVLETTTGKVDLKERLPEISVEYEKLRDLLLKNVYDMHIPDEFAITPLGKALEFVGNLVLSPRLGYRELLAYLGIAWPSWLQKNWGVLGGFEYGGKKVADREIAVRFKKEILEGALEGREAPRGYWDTDYWQTPLGQYVKQRNEGRKQEPQMVGVDYVWKNIIGKENRARWWVYKYAERLGGVREGHTLAFDPEVVRQKAREMGIIK